jgi:flagellar biosynthesis GTPase FlhF
VPREGKKREGKKREGKKTQWWSPRGVNEAQHLLKIFEQEQRDKELEKVTAKQVRESNKLLRDKLDAARKQRAATKREEKVERDRMKAEESAAKKAAKPAEIAEKSSQLPNQTRTKASRKSQQKISRIGGGGRRRRHVVAHQRSPTPPLTRSSTGRIIKPNRKLR